MNIINTLSENCWLELNDWLELNKKIKQCEALSQSSVVFACSFQFNNKVKKVFCLFTKNILTVELDNLTKGQPRLEMIKKIYSFH